MRRSRRRSVCALGGLGSRLREFSRGVLRALGRLCGQGQAQGAGPWEGWEAGERIVNVAGLAADSANLAAKPLALRKESVQFGRRSGAGLQVARVVWPPSEQVLRTNDPQQAIVDLSLRGVAPARLPRSCTMFLAQSGIEEPVELKSGCLSIGRAIFRISCLAREASRRRALPRCRPLESEPTVGNVSYCCFMLVTDALLMGRGPSALL